MPNVILPPEALRVVRESDALTRVLRAIETQTSPANLLGGIEDLLKDRPRSESVADYVIRRAMERMTGSPATEPDMGPPLPVSQHLAETLGVAWATRQEALCWAVMEHPQHGMESYILKLWGAAMTSKDFRRWKRAIELATTFDLAASQMIRWSHAATCLATD